MDEKQFLNLLKADDSLKSKTVTWENILKNIEHQDFYECKKTSIKPYYRFVLVVASMAMVAASILFIKFQLGTNENSNISTDKNQNIALDTTQSGTSKNISAVGNVSAGLCMYNYYRYNGDYYKLTEAKPSIQKNISKRLYDSFYEIKDINPQNSIALFINDYYWQLDYAFGDTIYFKGKPYLIDPNRCVDPNKYLGKAGDFDIYNIANISSDEEIAVKYQRDWYVIAYQFPSSLNFKGITYELNTFKMDIKSNSHKGKEIYIGKVLSYEIYKLDDVDESKTIIVHVNNDEEVEANAVITASANEKVPDSLYGSVLESIYPCICQVQWKYHGVYFINGSIDKPQEWLANQVGDKIDAVDIDGYTYELFQMKDVDPSKRIIVKNNKAYFVYDYLYSDTITFNGTKYIMGDWDSEHKIGKQIGTVGKHRINELVGVDPSKMICVYISASNEDTGVNESIMFYRY